MRHLVVMVGAGPAALYCTGKLVEAGHTVLILNRDIKPGGLRKVIAVARRGPGERAYDDREMEAIAASIHREALRAELTRIRPRLEQAGQNVEALYRDLTEDCDVPLEDGPSPTRLAFRFLASPTRVVRDVGGRVVGLEVEENALVEREGKLVAKGLGQKSLLEVDTVIFAIGDRVDPTLGLPVKDGGYATSPTADGGDPAGAKYQVFDPGTGQPVEGAFVVGWSRSASEGVVGKARLDGEKGAAVVNQFLARRPPLSRREIYQRRIGPLYQRLREQGAPVVHKGLWRILERVEREEAGKRGLPEFKFGRNEEMLQVVEAALHRLVSRSAA